jgi:serine/threonine protein kinase
MPAPPKVIAATQPGRAEAREVLYTSATTRVFRPGSPSPAGRTVCKEYLGAQAAQRLAHERNMLARLTGIEGVVQLAHGIHPAELIALQDIEAVTLAQVLQAGRCDLATVLSMGAQLARTLAEVHRAGVIHRDINPANILVSKTGAPVLIDFDLAVLAEQQLAVAQHLVGTLGYLAPEQTGRTGRAVDQRADLYALGASLYEMATGRAPFEGADTLQLIHDQLVREPVAPSQVDVSVPHGLSDIILRLLAKEPQ